MRTMEIRLRVVSNFGAGEIHRHPSRVASPRNFARAWVYFARPTIAVATDKRLLAV